MASPIRQDDASGLTIATEEISSAHHQKVIITKTSTGAAVSPLTDTELRASDVNVSLDSEVVHSIVDSGAITATLSAETTKVIGTVNISAGQTVTVSSMPKIPTTFKTLKAVSITAIATVWTPAAGKKFRLMGGCISVSAAASVLFEDNSAGTDVYQSPLLLAATPYNFDLGDGVLSAAINNVLKATASAAATISGTLYGIEE
jgi:hypothetical protein